MTKYIIIAVTCLLFVGIGFYAGYQTQPAKAKQLYKRGTWHITTRSKTDTVYITKTVTLKDTIFLGESERDSSEIYYSETVDSVDVSLRLVTFPGIDSLALDLSAHYDYPAITDSIFIEKIRVDTMFITTEIEPPFYDTFLFGAGTAGVLAIIIYLLGGK